MDRQVLVNALLALNDEDFAHVAFVCADAAKRDPERFGSLHAPSRSVLGLPEHDQAPAAPEEGAA